MGGQIGTVGVSAAVVWVVVVLVVVMTPISDHDLPPSLPLAPIDPFQHRARGTGGGVKANIYKGE